MDSLFKKINLLVKAKINDVLGEDYVPGSARRKNIDAEKLGPDMDKQIVESRKRINEALDNEATLVKRVEKLRTEIATAEQEADKAVSEGREEEARLIIQRIERLKQHIAIAEADLDDHRIVTQELIQNVNILESIVADAKHKEATTPAEDNMQETDEEPSEESTSANVVDRISSSLNVVMEETRQKLDKLVNNPPPPIEDLEKKPYEDAVQDAAVEDELAARRARLSKPENKKD